MKFREYSLMGEVMSQVHLLKQGLKEYRLPYECIVKETAHESLTVELVRKGEQAASFNRAFTFDMAIAWLESVASQLGRIHLLLAAEEEYLALAVKHCKKLYHSGMVDKHAFMTASCLANQVFAKDDMPIDRLRYSHNVIDMHEMITTREAADTVEKLIKMNHYN